MSNTNEQWKDGNKIQRISKLKKDAKLDIHSKNKNKNPPKWSLNGQSIISW
jgi:hypothetical protein